MKGSITRVSYSSLVLVLSFFVGVVFAHEWMAPKSAAEIKNPIAMDDDSIQRGKAIYFDNCASCHGDSVEGMSAQEAGLGADTPNLKKRLLTHTDGDFFWKIQNGRGDMPSFSDSLSDKETWEVINYIRDEAEE